MHVIVYEKTVHKRPNNQKLTSLGHLTVFNNEKIKTAYSELLDPEMTNVKQETKKIKQED